MLDFIFYRGDQARLGSWKEVNVLMDTKLKKLAAFLPDAVVGALAKSTSKNYTYGVIKWKKWQTSFSK